MAFIVCSPKSDSSTGPGCQPVSCWILLHTGHIKHSLYKSNSNFPITYSLPRNLTQRFFSISTFHFMISIRSALTLCWLTILLTSKLSVGTLNRSEPPVALLVFFFMRFIFPCCYSILCSLQNLSNWALNCQIHSNKESLRS